MCYTKSSSRFSGPLTLASVPDTRQLGTREVRKRHAYQPQASAEEKSHEIHRYTANSNSAGKLPGP